MERDYYLYPEVERRKSFDALACIDLYRFDIQVNGRVLPETKLRSRDEELTYVAEGINRQLQTSFRLKKVDGDLAYFDRGEWKPYLSTLTKGLVVARQEADTDPRKTFLAERAAADLKIGYKLDELRVGQTLTWYSKYPRREARLYGDRFIGEQGFQTSRKMGFLYQAEKLPDGSVELTTQSLDNSDDDAFDAVMQSAGEGTTKSLGSLVAVYDVVLSLKFNDIFYAGRSMSEDNSRENAWEVINRHQDLIEYYFDELEALAYKTNISRAVMKIAKKKLTYGFWAALKDRIDQATIPKALRTDYSTDHGRLEHEVNHAYEKASARGDVLFGCGGSLTGDSLLDASDEDVFNSIFGHDNETLKCVTCPFCEKEGVDADVKYEYEKGRKTKKIITCPDCRKSASYNL